MKIFRCALLWALISLPAFAGIASAQTSTTPRASASVTLNKSDGEKVRIEAELTGDTLTISNVPHRAVYTSSFTLKELFNANPNFPALRNEPDDTAFYVVMFPTPNEARHGPLDIKGLSLARYARLDTSGLEQGRVKITTDPCMLTTGVATFKVTSERASLLIGNLLPGDEIVGFAFKVTSYTPKPGQKLVIPKTGTVKTLTEHL